MMSALEADSEGRARVHKLGDFAQVFERAIGARYNRMTKIADNNDRAASLE
jgi:hypothetical protein